MKRLTILTLLIMVTSMTLFGQISGSMHDFTAEITNSGGDLCVFCHTPHSVTKAVLWNKTASVASYTFNEGTNDYDPATSAVGEGSEKCLVCHDGTVAIGTMDNGPGATFTPTYAASGGVNATGFIASGSNFIDTDLSDDHPLGMNYATAQGTAGAGELHSASAAATSLGFASDLTTVECMTCHDPHDKTNGQFLRQPQGDLCVACHNK